MHQPQTPHRKKKKYLKQTIGVKWDNLFCEWSCHSCVSLGVRGGNCARSVSDHLRMGR